MVRRRQFPLELPLNCDFHLDSNQDSSLPGLAHQSHHSHQSDQTHQSDQPHQSDHSHHFHHSHHSHHSQNQSQSQSLTRLNLNLNFPFFSTPSLPPFRPSRSCLSLFLCSFLLIIFFLLKPPPHPPSKLVPSSLRSALDILHHWRLSQTDNARWRSANDGLEPTFTSDQNGLRFPPDVYPARMNPYRRANATFVSLVRESDLDDIMMSIRTVEDRVNRKYPWVFLNEKPFTKQFKRAVKSMTRSQVFFGQIPQEHWSYPPHIDRTRAAEARRSMGQAGVIYGDSESYRHMCRFQSGFFFQHPLMLQFDYYWRVEPGIQYYCDLDYDPFLFMEENKKVFSFTLSLFEYQATIPLLWPTVQAFVRANPDALAKNNSLAFIAKEPAKGIESEYNLCHFWSNFELGDMRFWRSDLYSRFFAHLDLAGGFFYERWGDAPVHTIAAALFLDTEAVHQWEDIGYYHSPFTHCPADRAKFIESGKCFCEPSESFDREAYSCTPKWWEVSGNKKA